MELTPRGLHLRVVTPRRRPSPIDTEKKCHAAPDAAAAPLPVIKLPAAFTVDAGELGADLASKLASLDVASIVHAAAAARKAPRRMLRAKKAPQTPVKKKQPRPRDAAPPPCLTTVFTQLPHAMRSSASELRAIERRMQTLDVGAACCATGGWDGPPSRSLSGVPPPALDHQPEPVVEAPAPAEAPTTPVDDAVVAADAAADALAAAAAATFDEDTISSDESEEDVEHRRKVAARRLRGLGLRDDGAVRAAAVFVEAITAPQPRPQLHSPETFLRLRESHSKYYRYY